jgi:hypothetical protein
VTESALAEAGEVAFGGVFGTVHDPQVLAALEAHRGEVDPLRPHHYRPRAAHVGRGHSDRSPVMGSGADQFGEQNVHAVGDCDAYRLVGTGPGNRFAGGCKTRRATADTSATRRDRLPDPAESTTARVIRN